MRDTHGVEIANDHAGGRRRVLDFGDDRRALRALDRAAKRTPLAPPLASQPLHVLVALDRRVGRAFGGFGAVERSSMPFMPFAPATRNLRRARTGAGCQRLARDVKSLCDAAGRAEDVQRERGVSATTSERPERSP